MEQLASFSEQLADQNLPFTTTSFPTVDRGTKVLRLSNRCG
jgi:7-keto-8-aminopelargonate synthetase-like enzyme